jgi:peptide deformylase
VSLSLVVYPDPRLRRVCRPVETFDASLAELTEAMLTFMVAGNGVGLAGPQVGVLKRLFVCNVTGEPNDGRVYINPELSELVGSAEADEGCLSLPNINVPVRRAQRCTIRAQDVEGNWFEETGEDLLARVWQHETDHLEGTLILDRTSATAKLSNRRLIRELEETYQRGKTAVR